LQRHKGIASGRTRAGSGPVDDVRESALAIEAAVFYGGGASFGGLRQSGSEDSLMVAGSPHGRFVAMACKTVSRKGRGQRTAAVAKIILPNEVSSSALHGGSQPPVGAGVTTGRPRFREIEYGPWEP